MGADLLAEAFLVTLLQTDKELRKAIADAAHSTVRNAATKKSAEGATEQAVDAALSKAVCTIKLLRLWSRGELHGQNRSCAHSVSAISIARFLSAECERRGFPMSSQPPSAFLTTPIIEESSKGRSIKIYCDGVFDLVHAGHFNALRQAAKLGDELWVGIVSDEEVLKAKGVYPLYTVHERAEIVRACKWVTGIIVNAPYNVGQVYLDSTGCDFAAHGDDIALDATGQDCYAEIRKSGRLKVFKRTEGISTTTLVSRLLSVVDSVAATRQVDGPTTVTELVAEQQQQNGSDGSESSDGAYSSDHHVLPHAASKQAVVSSRRLSHFMGVPRTAPPGSRIVYTDGSFDIFHNGHVRLFAKAKALGDYLIVGIYDDADVRRLKGPGYPIQGMLDRTLNVLAMRDVDEVIMGVPTTPSELLVKSFRINLVVRGATSDYGGSDEDSLSYSVNQACDVKILNSETLFTTETVIERIKNNHERLRRSVSVRKTKEQGFYATALRNSFRCVEI